MIRMRAAVASQAKPLVGLYAESGKGKTKSALLLAKGFTGDMSRVAMIETEAGRGEAYAADPVVGGYNVYSLRESFSPKEYGACIADAEAQGMQALIIDSASHEWEGVGGVLAMAAANQAAGKKGVQVWQQPKIEHAREFMLRLTQSPIALVVVCMRARYPMYEVTARDVQRWDDAGRPGGDKAKPKLGEWARAWELAPKQSDDILFEMFVHAWIDADHRLHVTKSTLDVMLDIFRDGEPITVDTGKRLRAWADAAASENHAKPGLTPDALEEPNPISADQRRILETVARERGVEIERLLAKAHVGTLLEMPAADYDRALNWLHKQTRDPVREGAPRE